MGARASGQGGFARPRKACWRIFAARRKQALRGSRVRPSGLCLSVAHPRYRGSRAFPRRRGLAGHALMPTSGERPSGARAISRPFLRKFLNFFQPNNSMRAWVGHLFKAIGFASFRPKRTSLSICMRAPCMYGLFYLPLREFWILDFGFSILAHSCQVEGTLKVEVYSSTPYPVQL